MAKFNLSSVYSKDNIYSVLKLLKALIDTLDNYEFEEPILDKNGNPIPMEWFAKLYNSIHGDDNGNVEVGKDAHIDGNINVSLDATIGGLIKLGSSTMIAYVDYPGSLGALPAVFYYYIKNGTIIVDSAIAFSVYECSLLAWLTIGDTTYSNGVYTTMAEPIRIDLTGIDVDAIDRLTGRLNKADTNATTARTEASSALAKTNTLEADVAELKTQVKNKQGKLYLHRLTLTSKSGNVSTIAKLNWYSTNNLAANSLQNLTTLIKPNAGWTCGVTALDMDMSQGIPKIENTSINELVYGADGLWRFATPITKGAYPLTEVSDSVTAVD